MPKSDHANPCIKICRFTPEGLCVGCYRTRTEVKGWKRFPEPLRARINARVRPLMAATNPRQAKRAAKLDKRIAKLSRRLDKLRGRRAALDAGGPSRA